jgi:dihydrofolate reductase
VRQFRIFEHISLDAIIQAPGGPREDPGYKFGGWTVPFADPAIGQAIIAAHGQRFDLLLARRTYDIWAAYWPKVHAHPIADTFNTATKYVATHRPDSLAWGPAEPLGADIVTSLRRIKSEDAPDLILWGSSTLTPLLLQHDLVDEVVLLTYPVLLGTGKRFFSGASAPRELALVSSKPTPSGVLINTYRPVGPLRTGSFPNPPS